MAVRTLRRQR